MTAEGAERMTADDDMPKLPDDGPPAGSTIDRRLEQTDDDLDEIREMLDQVRASIDASREGDHERAAELLDEMEGGGS